MQINYQETTNDLLKRIDIHNQFGGRDIDQWMLDLLKPAKGFRILDVGCGAGKQCFLYHKYIQGEGNITGGDVNPDLLTKAHLENHKIGDPIRFIDLDFNKRFPFIDNQFDLESCCFALYYAADIAFTIREMHRVLKPGGRLFSSGPMPDNKQIFYEIIKDATVKPIPPMPGSSHYGSQILDTIRTNFSRVDVHIFKNPLTFPAIEPFLEYTRASLSEDRKLWTSLFNGKEEFDLLMDLIAKAAVRRLDKDGKLVMTKVVGGFVATK